ncbi:Alkylated DNA nucleotide flippase Atl1, participates in nucleotide excision repair, Ada-like DNA-binding domain [Streptomyces sp. 2224.1]|nr:Alkylated DNA nucleotide flippase Atl1, participates in nucleotide excision repair, Ada-like DNA-binding domain [Streptomyces sp. 2224.1]SEE36728.1 Alkylated DNA nucleotide flippase Atl1, participates in nucleotide excision repair, Ada-like DNA-binding domain [Streptomyces sp. 2112.3]
MSGTGDEAAGEFPANPESPEGAEDRQGLEGPGGPGGPGGLECPDLPEYAEQVLAVAELIPAGRVMTYGDVAEWLQGEGQPEGLPATGAGGRGVGGPRQVGRVMALYGGAVPWWRVVRADGRLLPGSELRALGHYRDEGTPLRTAPHAAEDHIPRLDMRRARWDGRQDSGADGGTGSPAADGGAAP